jgi:hypothetical protein
MKCGMYGRYEYILKTGTASSSEVSLPIYKITRHHIPGYQSLKFKVYIV